jgi:hypothetical protein
MPQKTLGPPLRNSRKFVLPKRSAFWMIPIIVPA